jgi:hypothetical protein
MAEKPRGGATGASFQPSPPTPLSGTCRPVARAAHLVTVSVVVRMLEVADDHSGLEHTVPMVAVEAIRNLFRDLPLPQKL